jgi:bifunctional DNase/RNase
MVQVRVLGVALDAAEQNVILLKPIDDAESTGRILPVWIGMQEATSILIAVEGTQAPRPLAHDLMVSLLEALDATVTRVEVTRIDGGTYYAEVTLQTPRGVRIVDARPSDAIALASRTDAPIWVADRVMAVAGIADTLSETDGEAVADEEVAEFRRFLDDVDPEDFQG